MSESGKEAEVFHMNKAISLIIDHYKKMIEDAIINNKTKKYGSQE